MAIERPDPWDIARTVARADLERRGVVKGAGMAPSRKAMDARAREFLPWIEAITDALYGPAGATDAVAKSYVAGGVQTLAAAIDGVGESIRRVYRQESERKAARAEWEAKVFAQPASAEFADLAEDRLAQLSAAIKTAGRDRVAEVNGHGPSGP